MYNDTMIPATSSRPWNSPDALDYMCIDKQWVKRDDLYDLAPHDSQLSIETCMCCTRPECVNCLAAFDATEDKKRGRPPKQHDYIMDLLDKGYTVERIVEIAAVSKSTVKRVRKLWKEAHHELAAVAESA